MSEERKRTSISLQGSVGMTEKIVINIDDVPLVKRSLDTAAVLVRMYEGIRCAWTKAVLWPRCGAVPIHRAVDRQPLLLCACRQINFWQYRISQTPTGPAAKKAIKLGGLVATAD